VPFFFSPFIIYDRNSDCSLPYPYAFENNFLHRGAQTPQKLFGRINACIALNANIIIMNPVVIHPKPESNEEFYTLSR
jgi:hypothetical protein